MFFWSLPISCYEVVKNVGRSFPVYSEWEWVYSWWEFTGAKSRSLTYLFLSPYSSWYKFLAIGELRTNARGYPSHRTCQRSGTYSLRRYSTWNWDSSLHQPNSSLTESKSSLQRGYIHHALVPLSLYTLRAIPRWRTRVPYTALRRLRSATLLTLVIFSCRLL